MSLLTIVQNATLALTVPRPANVIGNNNAQVLTLLALCQTGGRVLAKSWAWNRLVKDRTFTAVAQVAQNEPPGDFDRFPPLQRLWDSGRRVSLGPAASPAQWTAIQTWPITISPLWTMRGGSINITPAPATTDVFTYSYVTKNWIRPLGASASGSGDIDRWNSDGDSALIPEDLLELDLIWRFKQSKQLDYAEDMATFEREKEKAMARDYGPSSVRTAHVIDPDSDAAQLTWPGQVIVP